jgi:DHA1 family tetracycline resistance protein-like MFS transporter
MSEAQIAWLAAIAALPQLVFAGVVARLSNRWGRRPVLLVCIGLWLGGAGLTALTGSSLSNGLVQTGFWFAFAGRALLATGDAGFYQSALAVAAHRFAGSPRSAWAMGIVEISASAGGIAGPIVTTFLRQWGMALPHIVILLLAIPLFAGIWLSDLPRSVTAVSDSARTRAPLPWRVIIGGFAAMLMLSGMQTYISVYWEGVYHVPPAPAGYLVSIISAAMVVGSLSVPWAARNIGESRAVAIGLSAAVLETFLLGTGLVPLLVMVVAQIALSCFLGFVLPLSNVGIAERVPVASTGTAMGAFMAARQAAVVISPFVFDAVSKAMGGLAYGFLGLSAAGGALLLVYGLMKNIPVPKEDSGFRIQDAE